MAEVLEQITLAIRELLGHLEHDLVKRIAVAAPSCSTFTYGSQAEHWVASGQCDCIYYINSYAWDFPVVGALIAPRPLIILSGQKDTIFPPDGYHGAFQRAKKVYAGIEPLVAEDIADAIFYCVTRPPHVVINQIVMTPVHQASAQVVYRERNEERGTRNE